MLDQRALQLKGTEAIVGGLEHIILASDEPDVSIGVTAGHIPSVVVTITRGIRRRYAFVQITQHQSERARRIERLTSTDHFP